MFPRLCKFGTIYPYTPGVFAVGVPVLHKCLVPVLKSHRELIEGSATGIEFVPGHTIVCDATSLILGKARLLMYLVRHYLE